MSRNRPTVGDILLGIQAGKSVKTKERPARQGELGILKVSAVTWGEFRPQENKAVLDDYDPGDCPRPMHRDLLISRANTRDLVGAPVLVEGDHPNLLLSDKILRLIPDDARVDRRYLARALRSAPARRHFESRAGGTSGSMTNVTQDDIRSAPLALPSLMEQRRIAEILDKADAIRRKRKEAIALTEELLRSAFLEMFGDPVTNPKGWPVKPFKQLLAMPLRNGLSPASSGQHAARVLTLSAITRGAYDSKAWKDGLFAVEPWEDVRVDQRDFLICRGNGNKDLVGRGTFPSQSDSALVFPDTMIAARTDPRVVAPAYVTSIWNSLSVRAQLEASARTTNGTFKINQGAVEAVEIVCPPRESQEPFQRLALQLSESAARQLSSEEASDDLFNALVARAFSGGLGA